MNGEEEEDDIWDEKSLKQLKRKIGQSARRNEKSTTTSRKSAQSRRTGSKLNKPQRQCRLQASRKTKTDNSQTIKKNSSNKLKCKREDSSSICKESIDEDSNFSHQFGSQVDSAVVNRKIIPQKSITDGYCPKCQMPFVALVGDSPGWHVSECLGIKYSHIGISFVEFGIMS